VVLVSSPSLLAGGLVLGILVLLSKCLQNSVQVEQQAASPITHVRDLAAAYPPQNRLVTDIETFG
jgi:hypothetical protein